MSTGEEDQVNMNATLVLPEDENPEDHKFIRMKIQVAET